MSSHLFKMFLLYPYYFAFVIPTLFYVSDVFSHFQNVFITPIPSCLSDVFPHFKILFIIPILFFYLISTHVFKMSYYLPYLGRKRLDSLGQV